MSHLGEKEDTTGKNSNSTIADPTDIGNAMDTLIEKGNTILGLYTIKSDAIFGGMGHVFQVHHTRWNVDLAMKQPQMKQFQNEQQQAYFISECDRWIELGLHPHIVTCYYVRKINDIPSIFAEWMDGGSLHDWIYPEKKKEGKLYEGSESEALKRILDICIQFARGLHYAHEKGMIHKDVKPGNLLLTVEGNAKVLTAKVSDFGLTSAKTIFTNTKSGSCYIKSSLSGTPAYHSPEQKAGEEELTLQTDIWSWAVSVLEMFFGKRRWNDGTIAGYNCEYYFTMTKIPVPEAMKDLLRWCFKDNMTDRPRDFGIVEAELINIYQTETGRSFPRSKSKAASLVADSLNNKALSCIDIGKPEKANECWKEALNKDPNSCINQYNYGLYLWETAQIDDVEAIQMLASISTKDVNYYYYLAKLHLARADTESAIKFVDKAVALSGDTENLKKLQDEAQLLREKKIDNRCILSMGKYSKINSVCFGRDDKLVLSGSSNRIEVWDISTGQLIHNLKSENGYDSPANSVCFSPDWKLAFFGGYSLRVSDIETDEYARMLTGTERVMSVVCSPDGKYLLTGEDNNVRLWNIATDEWINFIKETQNKPIKIEGQNGQMKIISANSIAMGQCIHTMKGHTESKYAASICSDNNPDFQGGRDTSMKIWDVQTGECVKIFVGKKETVYPVCFSKDDKFVILESKEGKVEIYEILSGKCIYIFEGHNHNVRRAYSPNGRLMLLAKMSDFQLRNVETDKVIHRLDDHLKWVKTVCFNSDGTRILSGSYDKTVKLWDVETGSCIQTFEGHTDSVSSVSFSVDDKLVLSGSGDGVKIWDISSGACILDDFDKQKYIVNSVCFSPDGKLALSGGEDHTVKLWDLSTGNFIRLFAGHTREVNSVCFSPDGNFVLSGSQDDTVRLWHVSTGELIRFFEGFRGCISPDGKTVMTGSRDNTVKLWELATGRCIHSYFGHTGKVNTVCFNADGTQILSGSDDYTIKLWNIPVEHTHELLLSQIHSYNEIVEQDEQFHSICNEIKELIAKADIKSALTQFKKLKKIPMFASSELYYKISRMLASYCISSKVTGYTLRNFSNIFRDDISPMLFWSKDNNLLIAGCYRNTVKIMDMETGVCLYTLEADLKEEDIMCIHPDGRKLAALINKCIIKIWDTKTGQCVRTFVNRKCDITFICFSPNGRNIVTGHSNGIIRSINIKTGVRRLKYLFHREKICSLSFSPNGKLALSSDDNGTQLWNFTTGIPVSKYSWCIDFANFSPDKNQVLFGSGLESLNIKTGEFTRSGSFSKSENNYCFSPNGRFILEDDEIMLKLWDIKTNECIQIFDVLSEGPVSFSPDGQKIAIANSKKICILELDYEFEFPGWHTWDEGAYPYLLKHIALQKPFFWISNNLYNNLISDLQNRGYGWLRPKAVKRKMRKTAIKALIKLKIEDINSFFSFTKKLFMELFFSF